MTMHYIELANILKNNERMYHCLFPELKDICAIKQDADFATVYQQRMEAAERYLAEPVPALPYTKYKLFDTTGNRSEFEDIYMKRRCRLNTLAFMAIFDGSTYYLSALQDTMWEILNEYTWAFPAHLFYHSLDYYNTEGKPWHHQVIDLFAAETCQTLSEVAYLLSDRLDQIVVDRTCRLCQERILSTYEMLQGALHWEKESSNWTAVCAASVGMSAIYLVRDSELLARILQRVIDHMGFYIDGFADDGASVEGVGYWMYGITYFVAFAEMLYQRTNGKVNLYDNQKVENIAKFLQRVKLYGSSVVNFADCSSNFSYREGIVHRLKIRFPDMQVPSMQYKMPYPETNNMARWAGFIRDIAWRRNDCRTNSEVGVFDYFFKNVQWYISNREYEGHWYSFAVKGGNNAESHNHNDIGHFIYQIDGEAFLIDMGPGIYTKDYFGDKRYESIFASSLGHSVPIIDGKMQSAGAQYCARSFEVSEGTVMIDLSDAYENVGKIMREICFANDGTIKLKDYFTADKEVMERFVIASIEEPSIVKDSHILLRNSQGEAILWFDALAVELVSVKQLDGFYRTEGIRKYLIDFRLQSGIREAVFEIGKA